MIINFCYVYVACIPRLQASEFSLFGLGFSEKSWTYLLGAQLCFSQGLRSLLPSSIGLLFGYLYLHNVLYMQGFRLPKVVEVNFIVISFTDLIISRSITNLIYLFICLRFLLIIDLLFISRKILFVYNSKCHRRRWSRRCS